MMLEAGVEAGVEAGIEAGIEAANQKMDELERKEAMARVKTGLLSRSIFTGKFHPSMPVDYYSKTLEERRGLLGCSSTDQLCKTILFENTAFEENPLYPANSRFYMVVVQYVNKINSPLVESLLHSLPPGDCRQSRKKFNLRLAADEDSFRLSGYQHNALSPFGLLKADIPIIICSNCLKISPPILYLGGGGVDTKLSVPVSDFIAGTSAIVGEISERREG